jgi:hypothetical protein
MPLAGQVHASLIVVLTRGGSTARLVAKYRPLVSWSWGLGLGLAGPLVSWIAARPHISYIHRMPLTPQLSVLPEDA